MVAEKIKNLDLLGTTEARKNALLIAEAGLQAIDTPTLVQKAVRLEGSKLCINDSICSIENTKRVFVIGVGKCAIEAAEELEKILGDKLEGGFVLDVAIPAVCKVKKLKCVSGTHPLPTQGNVDATKEIIELFESLTAEDLVVFAVSGGGSTLLCQPDGGTTCIDEASIVEQLFKAGADIYEINTIRKHTSLARGGQLAKYAYPAQIVSLIFSDVPGAAIEFIASGPTVKDSTTVEDADKILEKYKILQKCGIEHCGLIETPKDDKYFTKVFNILVASNENALKAMSQKAKALGFSTDVRSSSLIGEAREMGAAVARELHKVHTKTALLYAGETTVTIKGAGKGGRNREFVMGALPELEEGEVVLSVASDGWDHGPYAGAIGDTEGFEKTKKVGADIKKHLENNSSEAFFEKTGDFITTGDTGSNVSDLIVTLKI